MTIEDRLTGLLRERADRPVDADALLTATLAAGRARKRRRHGASAMAGAGVAGMVAATLLLTGGPPEIADRQPAVWDEMPALPGVAGAPAAEARPDLVGTDSTVLRFAVPWAPFPVRGISWQSRPSTELITVQMLSGDVIVKGVVMVWTFADPGPLGTSTMPTVVDGHPAVRSEQRFDGVLHRWITWHPAENLTAMVSMFASGYSSADGEETPSSASAVEVADLEAFANSVRFDATTACSVPLQAPVVLPGGQLMNCSNSVSMIGPGEEFRDGALDVATDGRPKVTILYRTGVEPSATASAPPESVTFPVEGGFRGSETEVRALRPGLKAWVSYWPGYEAAAQATVDGFVPSGDPDDPATWPRRPLG